jgi:hypothetical protein
LESPHLARLAGADANTPSQTNLSQAGLKKEASIMMLKLKRLVAPFGVATFIIVFGQPATVRAYNFTLDSFEVIKNGSSLFLDSFDDGAAPPSAPAVASSNFSGGTAAYLTQGTLGPESAGKLTMDSSGAVVVFNFEENAFRAVQRARLNTAIGTNINNGLRSDDTFSVVGIFDLILPDIQERYGIRLTDAAGGVEGSDILTLTVTRRLDGNLAIQFRDVDDPANTNTLIDQALLDPQHSQICLRLERPDATDNSIFASFGYLNGGGVCGSFITFANTADIFNGENFTRAEFRASGPVPVPEAGSLWLIGFGLVLLFAARYL